jgi:hypothetical protein
MHPCVNFSVPLTHPINQEFFDNNLSQFLRLDASLWMSVGEALVGRHCLVAIWTCLFVTSVSSTNMAAATALRVFGYTLNVSS